MSEAFFRPIQSELIELFSQENNSIGKAQVKEELEIRYDQIVHMGIKSGRKYIDPEFTPKNSLLVGSAPLHPYFKDAISNLAEWKRPNQLSDNPKLFVDGTNNTDVIQGQIGDCYLLSSFSILGDYQWITDLFVGYSSRAGVCAVVIYKDGLWRPILIDDLLPVDQNDQLLFGRSTEPNEFWVSLLEKAYAKLHGSYESINTGAGANAMEDLTGGIGRTFNIHTKGQDESIELIWSKISLLSQDYFLTISRTRDSDLIGGIAGSHSYGIITGIDLDEGRLVKIRNPWGKGEWTGDWSDQSSLWTPELREATGSKPEEEGVFWMTIQDLIKEYDLLSECQIYDQSWSYLKMETRANALLIDLLRFDIESCLSCQQSDRRIGQWPEKYKESLQIELLKDPKEIVGPAPVRRVYRNYQSFDPSTKQLRFESSGISTDQILRVEIYYRSNSGE